jgi:hypothetical protein
MIKYTSKESIIRDTYYFLDLADQLLPDIKQTLPYA